MKAQPEDPDLPSDDATSGLPDAAEEITPLGTPADDDAGEDGRGRDGEELPGLPTSEPDSAG
jgi:hypothetical protein